MALYVTKSMQDIVTEALGLLNLVNGSSVPARDFERGAKHLQLMLKTIQAEGATMWMRRRECVDVIEGTETYVLADEGLNSLEVIQAMLATPNSDPSDEIQLTLVSRKDYMDMPGKDVQGRPTQIWFHTDEDEGEQVTLWPTPDASYVLKLDHKKKIVDLSVENDLIEVPDYWMEPIIYNLADRLAIPFGAVNTARAQKIEAKAKDMYDTAAAFDIVQDGGGEIRFVPGR